MAADNRLVIDIQADVKNLQSQMNQAKQITENYAQFSVNQSKKMQDFEASAAKSNYKEIAGLRKKAADDLENEFKRALKGAGENGKERLKIEQEYNQNRKKLAEKADAEIARSREEYFAGLQGKLENLSKKGQQERLAAEIKNLKSLHEEELKNAKLTAEEKMRIEKQFQNDKAALQGAKSTGTIKSPTAMNSKPELQKLEKEGKGTEIAKDQIANLNSQAGGLGQIAGKLGPVGMAIGAVAGSLVGLGAAFYKATEAANEFEAGELRIKTLVADENIGQLTPAMDQLRQVSLKTGGSLNDLQSAMYNVLSSVPALTSNLSAAVSLTEKENMLAIALKASTDTVSRAVNGLGNAVGLSLDSMKNQTLVTDAMMNTMNQGVMTAEELATMIARSAPAIRSLSTSGEEAIKVVGSMTALFTQQGETMEVATTEINSFASSLLMPEKRMKLLAAGLEGVDKNTGLVKDWGKLFDSVAKDASKLAEAVDEEAGKAIRHLAMNGGKDIKAVMDSFNEMEGLAEKSFDTMNEGGEAASKRFKASWENMVVTIGEGGKSFFGGVTNAANTLVGAITNIFKSNATKASEASAAVEKNSDAYKSLGGTVGTIQGILDRAGKTGEASAAEIEAGFKLAKAQLDTIKDVAPDAAQAIADLINVKGTKTADQLKLINAELENVKEIAAFEAMEKASEASEKGLAALKDKLGDLATKGESLGDTLSRWGGKALDVLKYTGVGGAVIAGAKAIGGEVADTKELTAQEKLQARIKEQEEEKKLLEIERDSKKTEEEKGEIQKKIAALGKTIREEKSAILQADNAIQKTAAQMLNDMIKSAHGNKELIDGKKMIARIEGEIGRLSEDTRKKLENTAALAAEKAKADKESAEASKAGTEASLKLMLKPKSEVTGASMAALLKEQVILQKEGSAAEFEKAGFGEQYRQGLLQVLTTQKMIQEAEVNKGKAEFAGKTSAQLEMMKGELVANEKSTDEIDKQIAAKKELEETTKKIKDISDAMNKAGMDKETSRLSFEGMKEGAKAQKEIIDGKLAAKQITEEQATKEKAIVDQNLAAATSLAFHAELKEKIKKLSIDEKGVEEIISAQVETKAGHEKQTTIQKAKTLHSLFDEYKIRKEQLSAEIKIAEAFVTQLEIAAKTNPVLSAAVVVAKDNLANLYAQQTAMNQITGQIDTQVQKLDAQNAAEKKNGVISKENRDAMMDQLKTESTLRMDNLDIQKASMDIALAMSQMTGAEGMQRELEIAAARAAEEERVLQVMKEQRLATREQLKEQEKKVLGARTTVAEQQNKIKDERLGREQAQRDLGAKLFDIDIDRRKSYIEESSKIEAERIKKEIDFNTHLLEQRKARMEAEIGLSQKLFDMGKAFYDRTVGLLDKTKGAIEGVLDKLMPRGLEEKFKQNQEKVMADARTAAKEDREAKAKFRLDAENRARQAEMAMGTIRGQSGSRMSLDTQINQEKEYIKGLIELNHKLQADSARASAQVAIAGQGLSKDQKDNITTQVDIANKKRNEMMQENELLKQKAQAHLANLDAMKADHKAKLEAAQNDIEKNALEQEFATKQEQARLIYMKSLDQSISITQETINLAEDLAVMVEERAKIETLLEKAKETNDGALIHALYRQARIMDENIEKVAVAQGKTVDQLIGKMKVITDKTGGQLDQSQQKMIQELDAKIAEKKRFIEDFTSNERDRGKNRNWATVSNLQGAQANIKQAAFSGGLPREIQKLFQSLSGQFQDKILGSEYLEKQAVFMQEEKKLLDERMQLVEQEKQYEGVNTDVAKTRLKNIGLTIQGVDERREKLQKSWTLFGDQFEKRSQSFTPALGSAAEDAEKALEALKAFLQAQGVSIENDKRVVELQEKIKISKEKQKQALVEEAELQKKLDPILKNHKDAQEELARLQAERAKIPNVPKGAELAPEDRPVQDRLNKQNATLGETAKLRLQREQDTIKEEMELARGRWAFYRQSAIDAIQFVDDELKYLVQEDLNRSKLTELMKSENKIEKMRKSLHFMEEELQFDLAIEQKKALAEQNHEKIAEINARINKIHRAELNLNLTQELILRKDIEKDAQNALSLETKFVELRQKYVDLGENELDHVINQDKALANQLMLAEKALSLEQARNDSGIEGLQKKVDLENKILDIRNSQKQKNKSDADAIKARGVAGVEAKGGNIGSLIVQSEQFAKDLEKAFGPDGSLAAGMAAISGEMGNIAGTTKEMIGDVRNIINASATGDRGEAFRQVGDMQEQIGKALLNAPDPDLQLVGALLLMAGFINKTVGDMITGIVGKTETLTQGSEDRANIEQRITQEYENQLSALETLNALQNVSILQGQAKLDNLVRQKELLKQTHDEMAKQSSLAAMMSQFTDEQVVKERLSAENKKAEATEGLAALKRQIELEGYEGMKKAKKIIAKERGVTFEQQEKDMVEKGMLDWDYMKNIAEDIFTAHIKDSETQIKAAEAEIDFRKKSLDLTNQINSMTSETANTITTTLMSQLEADSKHLEFLHHTKQIGDDPFQNKRAQNLNAQLNALYQLLQIQQANLATATDQNAALNEILQTKEKIDSIEQTMFDNSMAQLAVQKEQLEGNAKELESQASLLQARYNLHQISDAQLKVEIAANLARKAINLNEQLAYHNDVLNRLKAQGAAYSEIEAEVDVINGLTAQQLTIQQQQFDAQQKQITSQEQIQDFALKTLEYQRATGQITTLDYYNKKVAALNDSRNLEQGILNNMNNQGYAQDAIITQKEKIMGIDQQIYDLIRQQNGQTDIQFIRTKALAEQRDRMLVQARTQGKAVDTSQIEAQILATATEENMTADQIAAIKRGFRMTSGLPMFSEGGRTDGGMALLHPNEAILNAAATASLDAALGRGWLEWINKSPGTAAGMIAGNTLATSQGKLQSAQIQANSQSNTINLGGLVFNLNMGNQAITPDLGKQIAKVAQFEIQRTFNSQGIHREQL